MGQAKATLAIRGQPAWLHCARVCLGAGAAMVRVMISAEIHDTVRAKLPLSAGDTPRIDALVVPERLRRRGPVGSILHGIQETRESQAWLLWPVDHPFVSASTVRSLAGGTGKIRMPRHTRRRGHPLLIDASCRDGLLDTLAEGGTLRDFVRSRLYLLEDVDVNDPAVHWNCDDPAAFRARLHEWEQLQR